jgi:hypothetical protein
MWKSRRAPGNAAIAPQLYSPVLSGPSMEWYRKRASWPVCRLLFLGGLGGLFLGFLVAFLFLAHDPLLVGIPR